GSSRLPTSQTGADAVAAAVVDTIKASLASAGLSTADLKSVGIGSPGAIDAGRGTVGSSPNVPGFEGEPVPFGPEVSRALGGVDGPLHNDVRVAVLGEWKRGSGRPHRALVGAVGGR